MWHAICNGKRGLPQFPIFPLTVLRELDVNGILIFPNVISNVAVMKMNERDNRIIANCPGSLRKFMDYLIRNIKCQRYQRPRMLFRSWNAPFKVHFLAGMADRLKMLSTQPVVRG